MGDAIIILNRHQSAAPDDVAPRDISYRSVSMPKARRCREVRNIDEDGKLLTAYKEIPTSASMIIKYLLFHQATIFGREAKINGSKK